MEACEPTSSSDEAHVDVLSQVNLACYKARDAFYACLEKKPSKKSSNEIGSDGILYPSQCKKSRAEFLRNCRAYWVKHFDREYCKNKRVQRHDKGTRRGKNQLPPLYFCDSVLDDPFTQVLAYCFNQDTGV